MCLKLQFPYYHPLNCWLLGATKDKERCTFEVLRILTTYNGYNRSKYASKLKFPIITHLIDGC